VRPKAALTNVFNARDFRARAG